MWRRFLIMSAICYACSGQQKYLAYTVDLSTRPRVNALVDAACVRVACPQAASSLPSVGRRLAAWTESSLYLVAGCLAAAPVVDWASARVCPSSGIMADVCVHSLYQVGVSATMSALVWLAWRLHLRVH